MNGKMMVLLALLAALWIFGLIGQWPSPEAVMRYLTLSLALVAVSVWRWQPRPERVANRRPPKQD